MSGLFKKVPCKLGRTILLCGLVVTLVPGFISADQVVDDFSTWQVTLVGLDSGTTANAPETAIIGGERDTNVRSLLAGSVQVAGDLLEAQIELFRNQSFLVVWDGPDADTDTTDAMGLGGVDLTESGAVDGVELSGTTATDPCAIALSIYTDDSSSSKSTASLGGGSSGRLFLPFDQFAPQSDAGADMTNVGAISLQLTATSVGLSQFFSIAEIKTSRSLTASLTDTLLVDRDADGNAGPGDTVRYTAVIDNPDDLGDAPATGIRFTASPDSNTSLVIGNTTTSRGIVTTGNTPGDTSVAINIRSLPDGNSATVTFDVLINQPIDSSVTQLTCRGNISSDTIKKSFSTDDPDTGNKTDATLTPIVKTVIRGTVWNDINKNGKKNPGEGGISGVTLTLYHDADSSGTINGDPPPLANVTTDTNGRFTAGVANHTDYLVDVTDTGGILAGLSPTSGTAPSTVTVPPGGTSAELLFGYAGGGSTIGDTIWDDTNGDGVQNWGESGISGVTVALYADTNNNGVIDADDIRMATVTTGADGLYDFTALEPDRYIVHVTDTKAILDGYAPSTTEPLAVKLGAGEDKNDADFGFQGTASIGELVWEDTNGDGIKAPDESGIAGVTLDLYRDLNGNQSVDDGDLLIQTQTTASDGTYDFTHLGPGNYLLDLTDSNALLTNDEVTTPLPLPIELAPGDDVNHANIGILSVGILSIGAISGQVWYDKNQNGTQDTGEEGIDGISVTLYRDINADGTLDEGDPLVATLTTSEDGTYAFENLAPGDYLIKITDTTNILAGYALTTNTPLAVHVSPGERLTSENIAVTEKEGSLSCFITTLGQ